jgi:hypothetical protein
MSNILETVDGNHFKHRFAKSGGSYMACYENIKAALERVRAITHLISLASSTEMTLYDNTLWRACQMIEFETQDAENILNAYFYPPKKLSSGEPA